MKRSFAFFIVPLLFILSALAMRRWGLAWSAATPNFVLAVGAVYAVRAIPFVPYFMAALFASVVLAFPRIIGAEAVVALVILVLLFVSGRRLPWHNAVALPLLFVGGAALWYALLGDAGFFIRDPLRLLAEIAFGLAASGVYWLAEPISKNA